MINRLVDEIERLLSEKSRVIIAMDGRCGAGKTTLASLINAGLGGNVIHADDFFLRPEQRTKERLTSPGGNLDRERLESEVLVPLSRGEKFFYNPYDCRTQGMKDAVCVEPCALNIIEGSYSCHPELRKYYDYSAFLTVDSTEQERRIKLRCGEDGWAAFAEKWIPLEEKYFKECETQKYCDIIIDCKGQMNHDNRY